MERIPALRQHEAIDEAIARLRQVEKFLAHGLAGGHDFSLEECARHSLVLSEQARHFLELMR
jgi:hypothetical protein